MAIAGIGSGALAQLVAQSSALKSQITTLSAQASSGKRGTYYGDIAPDARRAISLQTEISRRDTHSAAIDRATGRADAAQSVMTRLSAVAEQFLSEAGKINGTTGTRVTAIASSARQALQEVAGLLNEKQGGAYLFGGSDTANPPIPDPANIMNNPMATKITDAIASLSSGNSDTVLAATLAAAKSNTSGETPFSNYLVDPAGGLNEARPTTLTGDGEAVATGLFANRNAAASISGSEAGGWSRDLLRGLMTLAGLTADKTALGTDFDAVMLSVKGSLKSAMTGLGEEAGALGASESQLNAAQTRHSDLQLTLSSQLSDVQDVDLATTLTALQDTQTRLQASWQALSMLSGLSLSKYL